MFNNIKIMLFFTLVPIELQHEPSIFQLHNANHVMKFWGDFYFAD